ncbi:unnamed protein product [Effrenium voratum]|nr:unnamed protein product [Effrenium voratum]
MDKAAVAMDKATVINMMDEVLRKHDVQIMGQLDSWLLHLDGLLQNNLSTDARDTPVMHNGSTPESNSTLGLERQALPIPEQTASARLNASRSISRRWSMQSYDEAIEEDLRRAAELHRTASSLSVQSDGPWLLQAWRRIRHCANAVVSKPAFDMLFLALIVTNSLYLGAQLEWASFFNGQADEVALGINLGYTVLFTMEFLLRLLANGPRQLFCKTGWLWTWLDIAVVGSSWVEIAFAFASGSQENEANSNLRIIRIFRIGKLLQTVRSFRVLKFLSALRTLVFSIVDATRSLFWALFLLLIILYIFGILFTDAVLDHFNFSPAESELQFYFGSVSRSMTTLFRSILGGVDWYQPADALAAVGPVWTQLFQFYIGLATLTILNVMTGVFCNSALRAAELNHDVMMQNRSVLRGQAAALFRKMDRTGSGGLTITEFEEVFDDEDMKALLESIDITATDAWTLFNSLNIDGDNLLTLDEFTEGCLLLRGAARSVDMYALKQQIRKLREDVSCINQAQSQMQELVRPKAILKSNFCELERLKV